MQALFGYLIARAKEPSTWAGGAAIAAAFGVKPDTYAMWTQIGIALAGAAAILVPEASTTK